MTNLVLTPFLVANLYVQQGIIMAMMASRFDPEKFEENLIIAKATLKQAAINTGTANGAQREQAGKDFEEMFALYLKMFRRGDINADTGEQGH